MTFEDLAKQYDNLANRANQLERLVGNISRLLRDDITQAGEWIDPRKAVIVELVAALKKWLEACEEDDFEPLRAESMAGCTSQSGETIIGGMHFKSIGGIMITIYFDRGRRMIEVFLHEVASTVEWLAARGYTIIAVEMN